MAHSEPEVTGCANPDGIGMVHAVRSWIADFSYDFESQGVTVGWPDRSIANVDGPAAIHPLSKTKLS
ncbi:MAG: hypothetical protein H7A51_08970 [Akkermansiaceae bacterium]|nr:hypothetical protein [Akkermansiaceae bacterium]